MKTPKLTIELNQLAVLNKHIADIEAALGQAELDHKELTAENQRLREAILNMRGKMPDEDLNIWVEKAIAAAEDE